MANQQEIDKIARSISFEVEAIPQDNTIQLTSTANTTPLNVRIKVRKKQNAGAAQNAVILIPKLGSPGAAPERVRLVSSDQTIMSFNIFMENKEDDKAPPKVKKGFFGFFKSGTHTDVEDRDRSKSPTLQNTQRQRSASIAADKMCSEPSMQTENISNESSHAERKAIKKGILGKYKPGGCLDPPFDEDRYAYDKKKRASPVQSMPIAGLQDEDLKIVGKNPTSMNKTNVYPKKRKYSVDDVLNMNQQSKDDTHSSSRTSLLQEENYTVTETFSNSLITYPPAVTVSEQKIHDRLNDKKIKNKISNAENNYRSSVQSSAEIYYCPSDRKSSTRSNNEKSKQDSTIGAAALINNSSSTGDDKLLATKTMTSLEKNHAAIPSSKTQLKLEGNPFFPSQSSNEVTDYFQTIVEELVTQGKITLVSDAQRYFRSAGSEHKDSENKYNVVSQIPSLHGHTIKTTDIVDNINNESELLLKSKLSSEISDKLAAYTTKEVSLKSSIKNQPNFSDETYFNPNVMETQLYMGERKANLQQPAEENLVITESNSSVKSKRAYIDYSEPIPSELIAIASTVSSESPAEMKASTADDSNIISNEMSAGIPLLISSNTCSNNYPIYFDNESNIDSLGKSHEPKEDELMTSMKGRAIYTDDGDLVSNELTTKFLPNPLVHPRAGISPNLSIKHKTSHADASNCEFVAKIHISPKITAKNKTGYVDKSMTIQNKIKTEIPMPTGATLKTSTKSQLSYGDNTRCKENNSDIKSYSLNDVSIKSSLSQSYLTKNLNEFPVETRAEILLTQDISVTTKTDNELLYTNSKEIPSEITATKSTARIVSSKTSTKIHYIYQDDKETSIKNEILEKITTTVFDNNELATKSYADTNKDVSKHFFEKRKPSCTDGSGTVITEMQPDTLISRVVSSEIPAKNQPENKSFQNYQIAKSHLPKEVSIKSSSKSQLGDTDESYKLLTEIKSEISSAKQVKPESPARRKHTYGYESNAFQHSEFTTLFSPTRTLIPIPSKKSDYSDANASELIPAETAVQVQDLLKTTERRQSVTKRIPDETPAETRRITEDINVKNIIGSSKVSDNNNSSYESTPRKLIDDTLDSSNLTPKSKFSFSSDNETLQTEIHEIAEYSSNADAKESILREMTANVPITKDVSMKTSAKSKPSYFENKNELNLQTQTLLSDFHEKSIRAQTDANGIRSNASKRKPSSNFDKDLISVELIGSKELPIIMNPKDNEIVKEENEISPFIAKIKPSYANNTETIKPITHNELTYPSFHVSSKLSAKTKPGYGNEPISGETPTNSSKTSIIIQPIYANDSDVMQYKERIFTPTGISMKTESSPSFADDNKSIQVNTKKPYMKSKPSYTEDNKFIFDRPMADLNIGENNEYSVKIENNSTYDSNSILNKVVTETPLNKEVLSKAVPESRTSHMNKLTIKSFSSRDVTKTSENMSPGHIDAINSIPNDKPKQIYSMIPPESQSYDTDTKISSIREISPKSSVRNVLSQDHCSEIIQTKYTTKIPSTEEISSIGETNFATESNAISIELTVEGTLSKAKRDHSYNKSSDTNKVKTRSLSSKTSTKSKPSYASYSESINETKRDEESEKIKLVQSAENDSSKSSIKRLFGYADVRDSIQSKLMALVSSKSSAKKKLGNAYNRKSIPENLTSRIHVPVGDDTVRDRDKGSAKEFDNSQASFSNTNKSVDRLPQSRELFSFDLSIERTLEGKNEVQKGRSVSTPSLRSRKSIESDIKEVQQHKVSEMYIYDSQIDGSIIEVKKESQDAYVGSIASKNTQNALLEPNMHANIIIPKSDTPKYLTDATKPPVAEPLIILGQDSYLSNDKTIPVILKKSLNTIKVYPNEGLYDEIYGMGTYKQSQLLLEPEINLLQQNLDDGVTGSTISGKTFKLVQDDLETSELMHRSHKMLSEISKSGLDHQESKTTIANNTPAVFSLSEAKTMSKTRSYKLRDATTSQFSEDSKYTEDREILKTDTRRISSISKRGSDPSIIMDNINLKIKPQIPNNVIIQGVFEDNTTGTENIEDIFQSKDSIKSPLLLDQLTIDGEGLGIQSENDFQLEKLWTASKEDHSALIKKKDKGENMPTTTPALSENETSRTDTSKDTSPYSQPASTIIRKSVNSLNSYSISSLSRDLVELFTMSTNSNKKKILSEKKQIPENKIKREVSKSMSDPLQDKPEALYHKQVTELESNGKISEPFKNQMKNLERVSSELSLDTTNRTVTLSATKIYDIYSKQVTPLQSTNFLSSLRNPEDSTISPFFKEDDKSDKDDNVLRPVENNKRFAQSYTSLNAPSIYFTDKSEDLRKVFKDASEVYNNVRYAKSISQSDLVLDDAYRPIIKLQDTIKYKSIKNKEDIYKTPEARVNSSSALSPSNFNMSLRDNKSKPFDHESYKSVEINEHNHNTAETPISYDGNGVTQQANVSLSSTKIKLDYIDRKILAQQREQGPEIPRDEKGFFFEDESTDFDDLDISEIDKSHLKSSIPPSLTYIEDLMIDNRLEPEKDVSESRIVVIDVAFQSYLNSRSERVIKSLNSDELTHHQDDTMLTFRSALRTSDDPIKIGIDSSTDLIIGINRRDLLLRESKEKYNMMSNNEIQSHVYKAHADLKPTQTLSKSTAGDTRQTDQLQSVLSTVYNNHMVPLQDIIHHLKEDIDTLATQQEILRQKIMINQKSKTIRISHTAKRCGCLRK